VTPLLDAVEIEIGPSARGAVIWMHGLGADGHDFEPIVPELDLPEGLALRFVFPHAPLRPVTINGGAVMRAWYDVTGLGGVRRDIEVLIEREKTRGLAAGQIVLAGFSQGGAMALQTGLRHPARLAGLVVLSSFLPLPSALAAEVSLANRDVPIFMTHGTHDPMIPLARGRESRDRLLALGYRVDWHEYPMPHSVCAEEIADLSAWLRVVLGPP
jgi:phospholipase/carboxylesterase